MHFMRFSQGLYRIEIICANTERSINDAAVLGINLYNLRNVNEICFCCTISRKEFPILQKLVLGVGGEVRRLRDEGLYFSVLRHRIAIGNPLNRLQQYHDPHSKTTVLK